VQELEWCERRLLARIHRYTLDRLRKEIEPVAAADFLRFLFKWQRLATGSRAEGPKVGGGPRSARRLRAGGRRLGVGRAAGPSHGL